MQPPCAGVHACPCAPTRHARQAMAEPGRLRELEDEIKAVKKKIEAAEAEIKELAEGRSEEE